MARNRRFRWFATSPTSMALALCRMTTATLKHGSLRTASTARGSTPRPSSYPNCQPSTTLWYHDHALGITRLNVYAGLAGFYLIRDEAEKALNLPQGEFEIPLMLQDRLFHRDGSLYYPKVVNGPKEHPDLDSGVLRRPELRQRQSDTVS